MKKVCMVVINSVSHDARVLKEADAVRQAGFDITIIGIQDANNNVPIEEMSNGVVIRRAAWQASALKPSLFPYLGWLAVLALAAAVATGLVLWLPSIPWKSVRLDRSLLSNWRGILTWTALAAIGCGCLYFLATKFRDYSNRVRSFENIQKRESNEQLKFNPLITKHMEGRVASILDGAPGNDNGSAQHISLGLPDPETKPSWRSGLPRYLMSGIPNAEQIRKWKVVFAREECVYKLIEEERPDIVHAHDLSALPVAARYAEDKKTKLIFDAHEIYDHLAQAEDEMASLNSLLLAKYSPKVDRFVTINDSIAHYYSRNYPALPKAVVVKNAARRAEEVPYDGRLHEAAGVTLDKKIAIYQGGFAAKRGLIQLLLSAEYLSDDWVLVYMGWGKLEDELRRILETVRLRNPKIDERFRFVPRVKQDELPFWTAGAKIGVIPYENAGLNHWFCNPNKLWEYPNADVPILASPFPEMRLLIQKFEIGWFLPDPLSPMQIAEKINSLTDEEIAVASANCRVFMDADNWSVYANRLENLYGEFR